MPSHSMTLSVQSPPRTPISLWVKAQVLPTAHKALHDLPSHLPVLTSSFSPPCSLGSCHTGLLNVLPKQQTQACVRTFCAACFLGREPSPCSIHMASGQLLAKLSPPSPTSNVKQLPSVTHHPAGFSIPLLTGKFPVYWFVHMAVICPFPATHPPIRVADSWGQDVLPGTVPGLSPAPNTEPGVRHVTNAYGMKDQTCRRIRLRRW